MRWSPAQWLTGVTGCGSPADPRLSDGTRTHAHRDGSSAGTGAGHRSDPHGFPVTITTDDPLLQLAAFLSLLEAIQILRYSLQLVFSNLSLVPLLLESAWTQIRTSLVAHNHRHQHLLGIGPVAPRFPRQTALVLLLLKPI